MALYRIKVRVGVEFYVVADETAPPNLLLNDSLVKENITKALPTAVIKVYKTKKVKEGAAKGKENVIVLTD